MSDELGTFRETYFETGLSQQDVREEITEQEQIFIDHYTQTLNKSQAYRKAFPDCPERYATTKANALLKNPIIKKKVNELVQKDVDEATARSPAILLKQIERYLELDPADYYHDDGSIKKLSELTYEQRTLIDNFVKQVNSRTGDVELSYSLPSRTKILDQLGSLVSLITKVRAVSGETADTGSDAAKKRDEIFNSVLDGQELKVVSEKIEKKRKKGRPRSVFRLNELPENVQRIIEKTLKEDKTDTLEEVEILDDE